MSSSTASVSSTEAASSYTSSNFDVVILDYNELLSDPTPELLAKIEKVCV